MPQMAQILAKYHGFRCTVLFSIDPESGCVDPQVNDNIPGWRRSTLRIWWYSSLASAIFLTRR